MATREERFASILTDLMEFDEVFSDFGRMGRCIFTDSIKTACIAYNYEHKEMGFYWNPTFFDHCSDYKNTFILCHEMLHIFLKHGARGIGLNPDKSNVMMDISINHLLVDGFGFQRALIEGWEELCWRDTVFNIVVPPMPSFEGYYNIEDQYIVPGFQSLDVHIFAQQDEDGSDEVKDLSPDIPLPETFLDKVNDAFGRIPASCKDESEAVSKSVRPSSVKKPKFELVVRNATKSVVKKGRVFGDTWSSINRRLYSVCPDLPVWKKIEERSEKTKYLCHFYIDNSGSCCEYLQRFANCANSLNEKVFEARVFTFDTKVYPVIKENGEYKVQGGGGTNFGCITAHVESQARHPDVVFVLTDGYAEQAHTKKPRLWHWLITECGSDANVRGAGRIWPLSQFE